MTTTAPEETRADTMLEALPRPVAWIRRHPLVVVAVLGGIGALVRAWWIWNYRNLGAYDPDEAGYLANALRFQRATDPLHPTLLWNQVKGTPTAPLVPVLSIVPLTLGPRDVRAALLIQPVLLVVLAVATAGITRRLASSWWAIVGGLTAAGLSTVVLSSTAYWFGLATATAGALAVWALLASDRLTNRWTWAFGLALGALPLTRTMAIGFVPGLVVAAIVLAGWDRRRLVRLALAIGLALLVAGPWWWAEHEAIWRYLFDYSYGDRSAGWGQDSVPERAWSRFHRIIGVSGTWMPFIVAGSALVIVVDRLRARVAWRPLTRARREALVLAIAALAGTAVLSTPRNQGVWFELPVQVLVVPLALAVVARLRWAPVRGFVVALLIFMAITTPISIVVQGQSHIDGALPIYDSRFSKHGAGDAEVAADWWSLNQAIAKDLRSRSNGRPNGLFITGNSFLVNSNSIDLAAEEDLWSSRMGVIDSFGAADVDPQLKRVRQLVVVRRDWVNFTPDSGWRNVDAAARQRGWEQVWSRPLPGGGDVVILVPPGSAAAGG